MSEDSKADQNRERGIGRYTFDGGLERLCGCGHPLGIHTAARAKGPDGRMYQDCLNSDPNAPGATGEPCDCRCFKPARKTRR